MSKQAQFQLALAQHLIVLQHGVTHGLPEQHAVRHVLEEGAGPGAVLEPGRVLALATRHCHVLPDGVPPHSRFT